MAIYEDEKNGLDVPEESVTLDAEIADGDGTECPTDPSCGENLQLLIEKLEGEKAELVNVTQRLQADFDNFRRRTRGEKEELLQYASEGVITKLLPVLDNFERALAAAKDSSEGKSYYEGVEMIFRQLSQVMANEGLETVDSLGCRFDPNCHEAVMQVEGNEAEKDTVIEVLQKGYRLKGKLIRPCMVKVGR